MSNLDLSIDRISTLAGFTVTTSIKPNQKYLKNLKKALVQSIECTGGKVFSIKLKHTKKIL
jgi:hypothetical protein